jgi:hypothetical protein
MQNTNSVPDLGHFTAPILKSTPSSAICCCHFLFLSHKSFQLCHLLLPSHTQHILRKKFTSIFRSCSFYTHSETKFVYNPSTVLFLKVSRKSHTTFGPRRFVSETHVSLKRVTYFSVVRHDRKALVTCVQGTQYKLGLNCHRMIMAYKPCTTFS